MKAFLLCAGIGNRLKPYTNKVAKPAIPFFGLPMMAYSLYYLEELGVQELVINTHHLSESIKSTLKDLKPKNMAIHFSDEAKLLGSSGGMMRARHHFGEDENFLVFNGDSVLLFKNHIPCFKKLFDSHNNSNALATFMVMPYEGVGIKFSGLWCNKENTLFARSLATNETAGLTPYHYFGPAIYNKRVFDYLPEGPSDLFDFVHPKHLKNDDILKLQPTTDALWFETGNPKSYKESLVRFKEALQKDEGFKSAFQKVSERFNTKMNIDDTPLSLDQVLKT